MTNCCNLTRTKLKLLSLLFNSTKHKFVFVEQKQKLCSDCGESNIIIMSKNIGPFLDSKLNIEKKLTSSADCPLYSYDKEGLEEIT